jgi:hypothetical protein
VRSCLFCNTRLTQETRSKEHVIPQWMIAHLEYEKGILTGKELTYPNEPSVLNKDSEVLSEREQNIESLVLGGVCKTCNNGWMSGLEVAARPLLESLLGGVCPRGLSLSLCDTIARWTFKTAVTLNYASNYKKIIPLEQIHRFRSEGRLPENATVDIAFCEPNGLYWVLGGNKKFALLTKDLERSIKQSYHFTLQFESLLLRLAWTPIECVQVVEIRNAMCRICPPKQIVKDVQITRRFFDRWQLHFGHTIFAEDGVYPNGLEL